MLFINFVHHFIIILANLLQTLIAFLIFFYFYFLRNFRYNILL